MKNASKITMAWWEFKGEKKYARNRANGHAIDHALNQEKKQVLRKE